MGTIFNYIYCMLFFTGSWMKAFEKYIPKRLIKPDLGHENQIKRKMKRPEFSGIKRLFEDD